MTIEKLIQENTAALVEMTAALQEFHQKLATLSSTDAPAKTETKVSEEKKKTTPKSEPKEEKKAEAEEGIPYDVVKNKTLELVKAKGRDEVIKLVKTFGKDNASAKDLKPEDYGAYVSKIDELLAEGDVA